MSETATTTRAASGATPPQPPATTPPTTTENGPEPATDQSHAARARRVHDGAIDAALDAIVAEAPPLPYEDRARIAYLLGRHRDGPPRPRGPTTQT